MFPLFLLIVYFLAPLAAAGDPKERCVYNVYVKTGPFIKAGTDSRISLTLGDSTGSQISVDDLDSQWGIMEPDHDYFEMGKLDIFSGRGPCLSPPLCWLNLTSDSTGAHHGWYCNYVEVTSTGPHDGCSQTLFYVRQWLAADAPPYNLTAIVDGCSQVPQAKVPGKKGGRLVIGEGVAASTNAAAMR